MTGIVCIADNYDMVIKKLVSKYANPQKLLSKYVAKLVEYKSPAPRGKFLRSTQLRQLYYELTTIIRNLQTVQPDILTSENIIKELLLQKIPPAILVDFDLYDGDKDTVADFFDIFDTLISAREKAYKQEDETTKKKEVVNNATPKEQKSTSKGKCVLCQNTNHETKDCKKPTLVGSDRFYALIKASLCVYCLKYGHSKTDCRSYKNKSITCTKCKSTGHNTLLHNESYVKPKDKTKSAVVKQTVKDKKKED